MSDSRSRVVKVLCAFLAPFATGFGISLAVAYLIEISVSTWRNRSFKSFKWIILEALTPFLGLTLSYILPTIYSVLNSRSPENGTSKLGNIMDLVKYPIRVIYFILGLLGSTITPSSHFDPWLPVLAGSVVSTLFLWNIALTNSFIGFIKTALLNRTPFLGGLIFVSMLVVFRGLGQDGTLNESVAPRYVMGTSLLVFGLVVLIFKDEKSSSKLRFPLSLLLILLLCSLSGFKTGLEWLSVRSSQTTILRSCLESEGTKSKNCFHLIRPIEEGDSNKNANLRDLQDLSQYLQR
jgi:hypothetical protein